MLKCRISFNPFNSVSRFTFCPMFFIESMRYRKSFLSLTLVEFNECQDIKHCFAYGSGFLILIPLSLCHIRFLRGDQYAIALALLDQGKVVLGVLACPNLPLAPIGVQSSGSQTGCLFSAVIGNGTFMESLDGSSSPIKVCSPCDWCSF